MSNPLDYRVGQYDKPRTYAVKHKKKTIRMASRSGGVFTALSDKVLYGNGVIYGCVMENNTVAVHIRAESGEKRDLMRGSKYIQSDLRNVFKQIQKDLINGKEVLFSGTSCQVAGLKRFLGKEFENLILVDIVCHGVPSPLVWKKYLEWQETNNGSKVVSVDFRNKIDFGWKAHRESLYLENGKRIDSEVFKNLFYGHRILRPACYQCPYKDIIHPSDITIADYWGIQGILPSFDDNKGVSLVLINNEKGQRFFETITEQIEFEETRIEKSMQPPLQAPFSKPINRDEFWRDLRANSFSEIVSKYGTVSKTLLVKRRIKKIITTLLK